MFDLFSNDTAEQAAQQRAAGLSRGYDSAAPLYAQGTQAARGYTMEGLTGAQNAQRGGLDAATGFATNGVAGATGAIGNGVNASQANANMAASPWQTLFGQAQRGSGAYGDAAGINGADGYTRARTNFQTDPAYQFQMDQGLQALQRTHAAGGSLASGGADADTLKFSQGLADQSYGNYLSRLAPYLQQQQNAAGGIAGAYNGAGNTQASLWNNLAGINATSGNNLATINGTSGNTLAGINGSLFGNLANTANQNYRSTADLANARDTGIGNAESSATLNNYNIGANQLNGITGLGQLAFGMPPSAWGNIGGGGGGGGGGGAGGSGGSLFSAFSGGGPGQAPGTGSNMFSQAFGNGTGYQINPWSSGGMFG